MESFYPSTLLFRIFFPFFIFCLLITPRLDAQWKSVGIDIYPLYYYANEIVVAEDSSIWLLTSPYIRNQFLIFNRQPIVYTSNDLGNTWNFKKLSAKNDVDGSGISPLDELTAYLSVQDTNGIFKTTDGGSTWVSLGEFPHYPIGMHFFNEDEGWVISDINNEENFDPSEPIYFSITDDGGQSWTHFGGIDWAAPDGFSLPPSMSLDHPDYLDARQNFFDVSGDTIMIGMVNGTILKSTDKGHNWDRITTPFTDLNRAAINLTFKDQMNIVVLSFRINDGTTVPVRSYSTSDGGLNWTQANPQVAGHGIQYIPGTDATVVIGSTGEANAGENGTRVSHDFGKTWEMTSVNASLEIIDFNSSGIGVGATRNQANDPNDLGLIGDVFLWQVDFTSNLITSVPESANIKVFPNPVREEMTLRLDNQWRGQLQIRMFNSSGKVMFENTIFKSTAALQQKLNVQQLTPGLYFLMISEDTHRIIKKFVVK